MRVPLKHRGMGQDYTAAITAAANQYGVDPNLALAVAQTESSMNPNAVSSEGAIGLFQLMPATAAGLGVDPTDPLQNIQGGVKYLSQLLNQFGGDVSLALAAYNAGPGNVQKYGGIPPFPETQNYVSKILGLLGGGSSGASTPDVTAFSSLDTSGVLTSLNSADPVVFVIAAVVALGILWVAFR